MSDGVALPLDDEELTGCIEAIVWEPEYVPYR